MFKHRKHKHLESSRQEWGEYLVNEVLCLANTGTYY